MQRHAHAHRLRCGPPFVNKSALHGAGGSHGIRCANEDDEAAVTLAAGPDHLSAVLGDQAFDEYVMSRKGRAHGVGGVLPGARAALHVRRQYMQASLPVSAWVAHGWEADPFACRLWTSDSKEPHMTRRIRGHARCGHAFYQAANGVWLIDHLDRQPRTRNRIRLRSG